MIVGHVLLCKHTPNLLKVPVWNARHLLHLLRCPPHMLVSALYSIYAEAKSIVIALTTNRRMWQHLLSIWTALVEAVVVGRTVLARVTRAIRMHRWLLVAISVVGRKGHGRSLKALRIRRWSERLMLLGLLWVHLLMHLLRLHVIGMMEGLLIRTVHQIAVACGARALCAWLESWHHCVHHKLLLCVVHDVAKDIESVLVCTCEEIVWYGWLRSTNFRNWRPLHLVNTTATTTSHEHNWLVLLG